MKKYFNLFALALVALFFTTACSNDDDPAPAPQKKAVKEYREFFIDKDGTYDPYFKSHLNYQNGVFSSVDVEEFTDDEKYTLFMKGDKIVSDDDFVVCQDMKFNADGFLTYVNSIDGKISITYSGRHIVTCVMEDKDLTDGTLIKQENHLTWEGGKLVSIDSKRTVDDEVFNSHTTFTYSSVPNQHKQHVISCAYLFLGELFIDVPGIQALNIFGDGADYAMTGYTEIEDGQEEVYTIDLTFDADGYITSEKNLRNSKYGSTGYCVTYKY